MKNLILIILTIISFSSYSKEDYSSYEAFRLLQKGASGTIKKTCFLVLKKNFNLCVKEKMKYLRDGFSITEVDGGNRFYNICYKEYLANKQKIDLHNFRNCNIFYKEMLLLETSIPKLNKFFILEEDIFLQRHYYCKRKHFLNSKKMNKCMIIQKRNQTDFLNIYFKKNQGSNMVAPSKFYINKEKKCIEENSNKVKEFNYFNFKGIILCLSNT